MIVESGSIVPRAALTTNVTKRLNRALAPKSREQSTWHLTHFEG